MPQSEATKNAVKAERERCVRLLEFYRQDFADTALEPLWYRIRNQVAIGTLPEKADLESQLEDDE